MTIEAENLAIKSQLSELVGDLWEMHQSKLRAMAADTGNKIAFRFAVKIDFGQKTPAGDVEIGFGKPSKRTLSFQVEDSEAPELPLKRKE